MESSGADYLYKRVTAKNAVGAHAISGVGVGEQEPLQPTKETTHSLGCRFDLDQDEISD
jgi:hypothetical protein